MTTPHVTITLPTEFAIRQVLSDMLGRDATVAQANGSAVEHGTGLLAVYRDDTGSVAAVSGWDIPLLCAAGGALGLVPPGLVAELRAEPTPRADLVENVLELCNVLVAAFDRERTPHLRLHEHHLPASTADVQLRQFANRHHQRIDLAVTVAGYGGGTLSVVVRG